MRGPGGRAVAVFVVLLAVYASTLGLDSFGASDYGGDEPHYLLAAGSLLEDGDLDVLDDYAAREYAGFYSYDLDMHGAPRDGALHEPHGAGFPALIAPAFALGGAVAVELFLAAIAALCGALAYLLARRVVADRWALLAVFAVGLSPPFLAYGTAVYPELTAGAALAGAALLALRLAERPSRSAALGCAALLATLPWLGTKFAPAGLVVGVFAVRAARAGGRRTVAVAGVQVVAVSAIAYVLLNQAVYGGPTPYAADFEGESATDASFPLGYVERGYRLAALFVDREYGLLRWAPVFLLALVGAWLAYRVSSRNGKVRETAAATDPRARRTLLLCGTAALAQLLVAAFLAPTMFGFWFPGRHLLAGLPLAVPLVAFGLARIPRTGLALAVIGVAASVWVWLDVRIGGAALAVDRPDAPWGPLDVVFPFYGDSALPYALTGGAVAASLAMLLIGLGRPTQRARKAGLSPGGT